MSKIVRVPSPAEFDSIMADLADEPLVFVVFISSVAPETGETWCPDCVIADPVIRKTVFELKNAILVECPVGSRDEYKNRPEHPYRVHPKIQLRAIPTLMRWKGDGPVGTPLVEEGCLVPEDIHKLAEL
ncbi:hypothetical protein H696_03625 [Fonticula alba]|uniref:Thioredoxin domain-containing protein n=1 Tax=Fonticula alba TaxID=691883 RepID=A0A058Z7S3_FONAL|nr:hypothetical protein H696_03625 [Fonticula alba]KCV70166.1 hypothetical protein H696_03625 [Fonticula alba]|eukprot:XP_009495772.1 hypothetical protein H696_03625 [Fonticula alba]